jgi:putative ABC transport system permease protein
VLEAKFADFHDLEEAGTLEVGGPNPLRYTGLGVAPEEFFVAGPEGTIFAEGELATLYVPLAMAQQLTARAGEVNDVVLTIGDAALRDTVQEELGAAIAELGISASITTRDDADAYRVLYEDIENDQQVWNVLSALILFAAALAAFNLVNRVVEAQRREIGIGMALGVPSRKLAIRPLLIGLQIAVAGALAGAGVGMLVGAAMGDLLESFLPLPRHLTPFQVGVFAQAAALGVAIPLVASAIPVVRAVRVEPIVAIRTGHLTAKSSWLGDRTAGMHVPGSSLTHMPIRNVLRTPRRTVLTALGVGAAITALVGVLGMLDSFSRTINRGGDEMTKGDSDRIIVTLDTFYPVDGEVVREMQQLPSVARAEPGLRLPGSLRSEGHESFAVVVDFVDTVEWVWTPTVVSGSNDGDGILIAKKAADDLGVGVGDTVILTHPARTATGFMLATSERTVAGVHANPIRTFVYADLEQTDDLGFGGTTNIVNVYPAAGTTPSEVRVDLFGISGVASSQAVARVSEVFDEALEQFVGFLYISAFAVLVLALLIAFNASRITIDERRREHATMRAFGLPVRTVIGVVVKESIIVGLLATAIGVAAGALFVRWVLNNLASRTLPDIGIDPYMSPVTIVIAVVVGVVAVSVAPLFLVRRVQRMDIPDTLRVME